MPAFINSYSCQSYYAMITSGITLAPYAQINQHRITRKAISEGCYELYEILLNHFYIPFTHERKLLKFSFFLTFHIITNGSDP
jgi:hypothetical protein